MKNEQLKPCPHCNSKVDWCDCSKSQVCAIIECPNCGSWEHERMSLELSSKQWNTRYEESK